MGQGIMGLEIAQEGLETAQTVVFGEGVVVEENNLIENISKLSEYEFVNDFFARNCSIYQN